MLKTIHTFADIFFQRKIYIWNINFSSVALLEKLAVHGLVVSAFVAYESDLKGQAFLGKPILSVLDFIEICGNSQFFSEGLLYADADSVIPDEITKSDIPVFYDCPNLTVYLNSDFILKKIYIYGAGKNAEKLFKEFVDYGLSIKGFLESDIPKNLSLCGVPVKKI